MRARQSDYKNDLLNDLRNDPTYAGHYLSAAKKDSTEAFLVALRDVAEARLGVSNIAKKTKLNRESLYRTLSEAGNPTLSTLDAVLGALHIEIEFRMARESSNFLDNVEVRFATSNVSTTGQGAIVLSTNVLGFKHTPNVAAASQTVHGAELGAISPPVKIEAGEIEQRVQRAAAGRS
jgi:probable addiction module antidote protein